MKYRFMDFHRHEFLVTLMARVLNVSRSGFYDWCKPRGPSARATARDVLDEHVKAVFAQGPLRWSESDGGVS